MSANKLTFEETKAIRLEILKHLDNYCRDNNLRYYLGFGTLLGAIRHHGFIPWDDDLDVLMPRPDLEKLLSIYEESYDYEIVTNQDNKGLFYGFVRIASKRSYSKYKKLILPGVNVEIYPIDGLPEEKSMQIGFFNKICKYRSIEKKMIYIVTGLFEHNLWPYRSLSNVLVRAFCRSFNNAGSKYDYDKSSMVSVLFGNPYKFTAIPKNVFNYGNKAPFEGGMYSIPYDSDFFLRSFYGDYMQLPPKEKRKPAHGIEYYLY